MAEFLYRAWSGWTGYTDNGKLPALLLASLLFLWFGRKRREQRALLVFASVMTVCCVLPVTAAVLMLYQTKFYNYEWIWSMVPATAVTAYGLTCVWTEYRSRNAGQWKKTVPVTLLMLTALLFCGSLGRTVWDMEERKEERVRAYSVAGRLSAEINSGEKLCLWAPREIMEYARVRDADILLPYGRNIWDGFLNAYSYDMYTEEIAMLEQWMANVSMTGEADLEFDLPENKETEAPGGGSTEVVQLVQAEGKNSESWLSEKSAVNSSQYVLTLEKCVEKALEQGVNCIMLAEEASDEAVARMETALGMDAEVLEGYYLFLIR